MYLLQNDVMCVQEMYLWQSNVICESFADYHWEQELA